MLKLTFFKKHKVLTAVVIVLVIALAIYLILHRSKTTYHFQSVMRGPITETVSVTGNTTPTQSAVLSFNNSGIIAHVYGNVGDRVSAGQVLAELSAGDLYAQIKQAQATVDMQRAKLDGLRAGSRPEDIAVAQTALAKANQDLVNLYASSPDVLQDAYTKANDAVRTQLDPFFTGSETDTPRLTYFGTNAQVSAGVETDRAAMSRLLNTWQASLARNALATSTTDGSLQDATTNLNTIRQFLLNVSTTLSSATSLNTTTLATYKASLAVAIGEVNTALKNINLQSQSIASQKLIVSQSQAQLTLKQAGSSVQDIHAQEAQVNSAVATLEGMQAKLTDARIVAPFSGTLTQVDAKVGQIASPGKSLISIISTNAFEVDSLVSEIDVAKITIGNTVTMTFDAFPNETFKGTVFFVDPAQTTSEGVVGYKVKIAFATSDLRMKSGLTANLDIATRHKDNVLYVSQSSILQNDQGTFVKVLDKGVEKNIPVKLGLKDQNGNAEVMSGVSEGQQVINIGLKQ